MSYLADLAKAVAGETAHRPLAKGLQLQVTAAGDCYRLLAWRRDTVPSEREIHTVRAAFGIPASYTGDWIERDGRRWYSVRWPVVATEPKSTSAAVVDPAAQPFNRPFVRIDGQPTPPPRRARPPRCDVDVQDAWVQLQRALLAKAERDNDQARVTHFRRVLAPFDQEAAHA